MTVLVGRDDELERLHDAIAAISGDAGTVVVIRGEPGIGKTALLRDVISTAADAGVEVRTTRADELDGGRTHRVLHELFPELVDTLRSIGSSRLPGSLDFAVTPRLDAADAVVAHVEQLRSRRPILLAVDDAQWADAESLFALGALVRRAWSLAIGVVLTHRTGPAAAELLQLDDLARSGGGIDLVLGPLGDADAAALAQQHHEGVLPAGIAAQLPRAGGNPWLITELVAHADGSEAMSPLEPGGGSVPAAVHEAVVRRLRAVDDETASHLRAAAVLGGQFVVEDLAALVDEPVGRIALAMARCVDAGFLADDGVGLRFRHDLFRQALESELPASVTRSLHRAAATVLRGAGAGPLRVAPHLVLGARVGDEEAFEWLVDAAEAAARQAPATAVDLLAHAAEVCRPTDPRRAHTEGLRARLLVWAGRPQEADDLADRLLQGELADDVRQDLVSVRARALFLIGRANEADALLRATTVPIGGVDTRGTAETALLRLFAADVRGADELAEHALTRGAGDPVTASLAHSVLGWTTSLTGRSGDARRHAERALEIASAESDDSELQRYVPHLFAAIVQNAVGDAPGARLTLRSGRAVGARLDIGWDRAVYDWAESVVAFMTGDWSDALVLGEAGSLAAEESGLQLGVLWHVAIGALVATRRGDVEQAAAMLERADAIVASRPVQFGFDWYAWAHATALIDAGNVDVGVMLLDGAWQVAEQTGARSTWHIFGVDLAAAGRALERRELTERVADGLEALAEDSGLALHRGLAQHARGLHDDDPDVLLSAATTLAGVRRPFEHARALGDAAVAHARRGGADAARRSARESLAAFDALGARACEARLRESLRGLGVVVRGSTRPRESASGWGSLTRSEEAVVELVAIGLSNGEIAERLFVSRRTVESHLVHVYAKVGARSRVELARQVAERR